MLPEKIYADSLMGKVGGWTLKRFDSHDVEYVRSDIARINAEESYNQGLAHGKQMDSGEADIASQLIKVIRCYHAEKGDCIYAVYNEKKKMRFYTTLGKEIKEATELLESKGFQDIEGFKS